MEIINGNEDGESKILPKSDPLSSLLKTNDFNVRKGLA